MKIEIKKTTIITDETDWFRVAPPKGGIAQWKDGYSAKELAKFVTKKSQLFEDLITKVISDIDNAITEALIGEPEVETKFPEGNREGRNHDLLLYNETDDLIIGIEAKVKETFGSNSIYKEYVGAKQNTDKYKRIEWIKRTLIDGKNLQNPEIKNLKYQLFTATAGTLLEAYKRGKSKCILLVLSFHEGKKGSQSNKCSFDDFVKVVCPKNNSKEFKIKVGDNNKDKNITCWFVYKEIKFTSESFET